MSWLENLPDNWWKKYQSFSFSSQCIQELTIELLFITRCILLETRTYSRVCKRSCLLINDFQNALDARHIHRSINSRNDIKESIISISSLLQSNDDDDELSSEIDHIEMTIHWLAIDGEQPIISENLLPNFTNEKFESINKKKIIPSQIIHQSSLIQQLFHIASSTETKNTELQDHTHPLTKNNLTVKPIHPRNVSVRRSYTNNHISIQPSSTSLAHELSIEQQFYFKTLTESCFNGTEQQRMDAFHCLSSDAALQPLLPRLLLFVSKGIQTNIYLHDLNYILQFLTILKTLTMNTFLVFDKYLHLIIPSLLTCLLCVFDMTKNLSQLSTIDQNNYTLIWFLREQTSDLIYYFEKKYSMIPYFTQRIVSIIQSNMNTTYSIAYSCIRTLFLIDMQMYNAFIIDILRNDKKPKVFEPDFDLDRIEQQTLFDQKISQLFEKYHLSF